MNHWLFSVHVLADMWEQKFNLQLSMNMNHLNKDTKNRLKITVAWV